MFNNKAKFILSQPITEEQLGKAEQLSRVVDYGLLDHSSYFNTSLLFYDNFMLVSMMSSHQIFYCSLLMPLCYDIMKTDCKEEEKIKINERRKTQWSLSCVLFQAALMKLTGSS